ncbi:MAG: hypothetical protein U5K28_07960 [Halobacteriales archaeon]|nr:hypothetical protein [Halobacteriales archaeon]
MAPDSAGAESAGTHGKVMAAIDDDTYLIADVSRDDAWLSMPAEEAPVLADYC